jgi:uncharacterized alpha-E superfamily protein
MRVGTIVFAQPLTSRWSGGAVDFGHKDIALTHHMLALQLQQHSEVASLPLCVWDRQLTAREVRQKCASEELWEAIAEQWPSEWSRRRANAVEPSLLAAVALQDLLDEEMGGWPNTFG